MKKHYTHQYTSMDFALDSTVKIKRISEEGTVGVFEIEGLYRGYGTTIGNALRRILLSSLPGPPVTKFKIKGVGHEFTTIPGVVEDVVEFGLNLKKIRFHFHAQEPQTLTLKVKGEKEVTAGDIAGNTDVHVQNPDLHLATLSDKSIELDVELTIERGLGYLPVELQKVGKLPVGTIALDAIFSPVRRVNSLVSNMRVGERTDYDKINLEIETDGTISPSRALQESNAILMNHLKRVGEFDVQDISEDVVSKEKESKGKK